MRLKSPPNLMRRAGSTAGLAGVLGAIGLQAQEIVDLPGEDRPVSPDFEFVYSIGSAAAAAAWEEFTSISGVAFDGEGNLYLLDGTRTSSDVRIVVVDAAGRFVREFGRAGDGPGEFRAATQLVVWEDGQVLVEDMMHAGYHAFSPAGEFERTVMESGGGLGFAMARRPDLRPERTGGRTLIGRSRRTIQRVDMSSEEVVDRVLVEPWDPGGEDEREDGWVGDFDDVLASIPVEWGFEPQVWFDALPAGGVAFSDSSVWAIKLTDASGDITRILRRPIRPLPVTEEMKSLERERRVEQERGRAINQRGGPPPPQILAMISDYRAAQIEAVENMRFFAEVPVIAALRSTWDGALWIQRSTEPGSGEPGPIDVISPAGRYAGTLATGTEALPDMPDAFGPDGLVAFLDKDEFDVPVITVKRLPPAIRLESARPPPAPGDPEQPKREDPVSKIVMSGFGRHDSHPRRRALDRRSRAGAPRTLLNGAVAAVLGAVGLQGQEVVDLPAEDLPLSVDLESVYRIGSALAASDWEQFTAIRHIGFDGEGNLYMLDAPGPEAGTRIVVVNPAGRHVTDFGRHGDGPGEFRWPRSMMVWPDGGTFVQDVMHMGYHIFGPEGDFDHMVRDEMGRDMRPDGSGVRTVVGASWRRADDTGRSIVRFDVSSEEVTTRILVEGWDPRPEDEGRSAPESLEDFVEEVWAFEPVLLFDVLPSGGIAFSESSAYAIKLTDRSGAISRILRRPLSPVPATEAIRQAERDRRIGERRGRGITSSGGGERTAEMAELTEALANARMAAVENMRFFPEVPVIAAVRATWDGTLWIQRSAEPGSDEPGPIDVVALDARYLGTLATGTAALPDMPDAFGPDGLVAFLDTDEFDVPVITVRRLPPEIR